MFAGTGPHVAVGAIQRVCAELDRKPPRGYLDSLAAADTLKANLAAISTIDTSGDLLDAVFEALLAGRHPADDEQVRRLLVMTQLQNLELHRKAEDRAKQMRGDTVCQYADEFISAWATATADDGAILSATAALDVFASVPDLNDMHPSQLIDVQHHKAWVSAATAARRLDAAAAGFGALLSATRLTYPPAYGALILAPGVSLDELAEFNRGAKRDRGPSAWTFAQHGMTPKLCGSLGDFAAACGAVSSEQTAREEAARLAATPKRFR